MTDTVEVAPTLHWFADEDGRWRLHQRAPNLGPSAAQWAQTWDPAPHRPVGDASERTGHPESAGHTPQRLGDDVGRWRQRLSDLRLAADGSIVDLEEAEHLDLLRDLEDLKSAAAAAQAVVTASLDRTRRDREQAEGVPSRCRGRGLSSEIALARRLSPHQGGRQLGLARRIAGDMPHTLRALRSGQLSEARAALVAAETTCLSREERAAVDKAVCGDPARFADWGDRRLATEARRRAYEQSPTAMLDRIKRAEGERHVALRPAPDATARACASGATTSRTRPAGRPAS